MDLESVFGRASEGRRGGECAQHKQDLLREKTLLLEAEYQCLQWQNQIDQMELYGECEEVIESVRHSLAECTELVGLHQTTCRELEARMGSPSGHPQQQMVLAGLEVNRSIQDYELVNRLSKSTFVARYKPDGSRCVLKCFALNQKEGIQDGIWALHQLRHPGIGRIEAYFAEEDVMVVQMPLYEGKTLSRWIQEDQPHHDDVRYVFVRLLQAIIYLHMRNIVHGNLSLDAVILDGRRPVIVDFDLARPAGVYKSETPVSPHCAFVAPENQFSAFAQSGPVDRDYTAPEMRSDAPMSLRGTYKVSTASDMFSVGIMFYKTFFGVDKEVDMTEDGAIRGFDSTSVGRQAFDLITDLLNRDPEARLTAVQATEHPFLRASTLQKLLSSGEYVQSQKKVSFFREAIGVVRNRDDMLQGRKPVDIRRDHLVDDVFEKFGAFTAEDFKGSLFIKFVGEEGVDQGGLLSNMYNEFYRQVIHIPGLFETNDRKIMSHVLPIAQPEYSAAQLEKYRVLGAVLAKCIMDARLVPSFVFASSFYKFITNTVPCFHDLESFSPTIARSLHHLLSTSGVQEWYMTWEDAGGSAEELVTDANKHEYVRARVQWLLVDSRRGALEKIREGFFWCASILEVEDCFRMMSYDEMVSILCGQNKISAQELSGIMDFSQAGGTSLQEFLERIFAIWEAEDPQKCIQFVEFITGLPTIPSGGFYNPNSSVLHSCKILLVPQHGHISGEEFLPRGLSCSFQIHIYPHATFEQFQRKLEFAMSWVSGGFHME